jgi:hypothetical protein
VHLGRPMGQHAPVRLTDFWQRMDEVFGAGYARSWAHDHVIAELDGRTVDQALAAGEETVTVWRAVCRHAEVPSVLR